jgi:NAD(P)-dependent dehydrogenase (short-subunit alcohol dehydrogenase family)
MEMTLDIHRGLGAVICEKFAAHGADVAVNYVNNKERADQVAEKCRREFGVHTVTLQAVRQTLLRGLLLLPVARLMACSGRWERRRHCATDQTNC